MAPIRRALIAGAATVLCAPSIRAQPAPLRIGVLTDMSGSFSGNTGAGSVLAVRMAVEDAGGAVSGRPIEVIVADHKNRLGHWRGPRPSMVRPAGRRIHCRPGQLLRDARGCRLVCIPASLTG